MARKQASVFRCDLLAHAMNAGKEAAVRSLFRGWRASAFLISAEQWRLFFETGRFNKMHKAATASDLMPAAHRQMIRHEVVGILSSFIASRQNDFTRIVNHCSLSESVRHELHFINRWAAWYWKEPLTVGDSLISPEVRKLARKIMGHVLGTHRQPDMSRVNMVIDQRAVSMSKVNTAQTFPLWVRLSTLSKGSPIWVPLQSHPHFEERQGEKARTVQINMDREGKITFGILTDISQAIERQKENYTALCDEIALDLGVRTLFATDKGDLLGRQWLARLQGLDKRLTELAAYRQSRGLKVRCPRYDKLVSKLRGLVRSEINRILKRLVERRKPERILVERLSFRGSHLSRRLNRLLSRFGKQAVSQKLSDLHQRYGIEIDEVNPAYSSQECCECGYVDKRNRPEQEAFSCKWCGSTGHADVNAARVHRRRRSVPDLWNPFRRKHDVLEELVRRFSERHTRFRGGPADPRLSNPYFRERTASVTSIV
jgi:putative transposase